MKSNIFKVILFFVVSVAIFSSCSKDDVIYTISGAVLNQDSGMSGVTITYAGGTVVTDEQGKYSFTVDEKSSITITPTLDGYSFSPSFIEIVSIASDAENQDFKASMVYDVNVDFQNTNIPETPGYIDNAGAGLDGIFTEDIVSFPNYYNTEFSSWSGFTYSQVHDMITNDYTNFGVYVANDPSTNKFMFAHLADPVTYSPNVSVSFSKPVKNLSFDVANATYAALSMKDGDGFAKKFTSSDWFELTITATNSNNEQLTPQTFKLADGTKIVDAWKTIDIVGEGIAKLQFSLASTDNGNFGMNTPAYFCIDNIKARIVK